MLRPLLERTVEVVKAGLRETPPVVPPRQLRPVLQFARLPDRALTTVAAALDADEVLRARVSKAVGAGDPGTSLGRAAHLFLVRPDGWQGELDEIVAAAVERSTQAGEAADDRRASRRLVAMEEEVGVLAAALEAAREQVAQLSEALGTERLEATGAKEALAEASSRISRLERERDAAHRRAAAMEREAEAVRSALADERREREHHAAARAQGHLDDLAPSLRAALRAAAAAATDLHAAIASASEAIDAIPNSTERDPATDVTAADAVASRAGRASGSAARRRPAPIPAGLFAESDAAADHLVRLAGARLLIDGYNASLRAWDDIPLSEQRSRLVGAAAELAARTGAAVTIVFDGSQDTGSAMPASGRRGVDVRFTPSHIEADDAILDLVDGLPLPIPVIVASDDRRVRAGAEERGANVLTQRQLFSLLRREIG